MVWPIIAGAAAPWLLRGAPAIGRGAKTMWDLGKGLGTPLGRRQAGRALWQQPGSIPRNPVTGAFEAGSRGPGAAQRAGQWFAGQPTWKQSLMGAGAGTVPYMMWPDPDEEQPEGRPVDSAALGVPPGAGPSPSAPAVRGGFASRAVAERERMLENMSMLMKQGAILAFVNPKGAKEHTKRAIEIMKMDAESRNAVEDAKIIEDVFTDGKLPKTAKLLYERLAPKVGPAKAAEVSGYTLETRNRQRLRQQQTTLSHSLSYLICIAKTLSCYPKYRLCMPLIQRLLSNS